MSYNQILVVSSQCLFSDTVTHLYPEVLTIITHLLLNLQLVLQLTALWITFIFFNYKIFKLKKCKFDLEQKHFLIFIFSFVKESDKEFLCIRSSAEEFFMHGIQLIMFRCLRVNHASDWGSLYSQRNKHLLGVILLAYFRQVLRRWNFSF